MPKLSQTFADTVPTIGLERDAFYWDAILKGFGLKVTKGGRRRWVFQYSDPARRRRYRRFTIADAAKLPAVAARRKALQLAAMVADGRDPLKEQRTEAAALTLEGLSERYMAEHAIPKKKARSAAEDAAMWRRCILPRLGPLKVAEISGVDLRRLHHELRETPIQANRCLSLLSKALSLAIAWGLRSDGPNPARGIERYRENKRRRYLSGAELVRLGVALKEAEEDGAFPSAVLAIRLLLLTGARRGEILGLKWSEIDFERGSLELQDSKTGAKTIPIGAPVLRLLADAVRFHGNPYVCPGRKEGRPIGGLSKSWERIRERAGLEGVRVHDLRHGFASIGASSGLGLPVIGALLGHADASTTARYAHISQSPLHAAAEAISGEIAAHLEGKPGEVREFRKRRP